MNEKYIKRAIELAKEAMKEDEVPVGAVVVYNDEIIGEGKNERNNSKLISRHAEIIAIENAQRKINQTMLENCDIYVTLEPCIMCASAIQHARIKNVYFGTKDIRMWGYGSKIDVSAIQGLNHYPIIHQIKNQDECGQILKDFFKRIRSAK